MPYSGGGSYSNTDWAREALGLVGGKPSGSPGGSPKAKKPKAKRQATVPKSIIYPKITPRNPIKISNAEKLGAAAVAYGSRAKVSAAAKAAARALGSANLKTLPKGGVLGAAAIAGAVAYALTTAVIKRNARTTEELRANAFELSQAYRRLRADLEYKQGRKLTPAQQRAAGAAFQKGLLDLGLSARDLSKLNQKFFEKGL